MLSESERKIMEIISKQLLITKGELLLQLEKEKLNGAEISLSRLRQIGYIDKVESLGTCYVLTQAGQRALREP